MKVLDLFSGIGGFSLGLEAAGMETVGFCEIEEYPRKILKRHWPHVPIFEDIRKLDGEQIRQKCGKVDLICGGFPCQDLSTAGKQSGIDGGRSGLWREMHRLIGELRPEFAIVENVTNLLTGPKGRGEWFGRVLGDLAEIGYDAEWHCIPASYVGAPHIRDRVWVIAYPHQNGRNFRLRFERRLHQKNRPRFWESFRADDWAVRVKKFAKICRNDDGLPEELGAIGNSVVPQVVEQIGRAIMQCK